MWHRWFWSRYRFDGMQLISFIPSRSFTIRVVAVAFLVTPFPPPDHSFINERSKRAQEMRRVGNTYSVYVLSEPVHLFPVQFSQHHSSLWPTGLLSPSFFAGLPSLSFILIESCSHLLTPVYCPLLSQGYHSSKHTLHFSSHQPIFCTNRSLDFT